MIDVTRCARRRDYDVRACPACGRLGDYGEYDTSAGPCTGVRVTHRLRALASGSFEILDDCDATVMVSEGNAKAPTTA